MDGVLSVLGLAWWIHGFRLGLIAYFVCSCLTLSVGCSYSENRDNYHDFLTPKLLIFVVECDDLKSVISTSRPRRSGTYGTIKYSITLHIWVSLIANPSPRTYAIGTIKRTHQIRGTKSFALAQRPTGKAIHRPSIAPATRSRNSLNSFNRPNNPPSLLFLLASAATCSSRMGRGASERELSELAEVLSRPREAARATSCNVVDRDISS